MDPSEIKLESVSKLFEYEKQSRFIDELSFEELKNFSKIYCKLYLRQQEVLATINKM
jgi:hypothetical protein